MPDRPSAAADFFNTIRQKRAFHQSAKSDEALLDICAAIDGYRSHEGAILFRERRRPDGLVASF
jgi:hypothetical protein